MASVAVALGPATVNAQSPAATRVPDGIVSGQPQISIPKDVAAKMAKLDVPAGKPVDATRASTALDEYWTPERMANAIPMDTPTIDIDTFTQPAPAARESGPTLEGLAEPGANAPDPVVPSEPVADVEPRPHPNANNYLAPANGRIYFTTDAGPAYCSGAAVNSPSGNLVATSAHCVHGGQGKGFYQNWVFAPNYAFGTAIAFFQAKKFYTFDEWSAIPSTPNTAYRIDKDIAFVATFNQPDGRTLVDRVGGHGLRTSGPLAFAANIFGYPLNRMVGEIPTRCWGNTEEWTLEGYTFAKGACNFNEGGSGGPWLADMNPSNGYGYIRTVSAVHVTWNDGSPSFNAAPGLDSRAMALYQTANSGL
ncbi:hypothetical protein [Prescottella agglutinans]|uniref:trypsin-like serine peptidase n=1 Tax=Prescottella agglutinans TaxID=1644129 RepID=UPI003D96B446